MKAEFPRPRVAEESHVIMLMIHLLTIARISITIISSGDKFHRGHNKAHAYTIIMINDSLGHRSHTRRDFGWSLFPSSIDSHCRSYPHNVCTVQPCLTTERSEYRILSIEESQRRVMFCNPASIQNKYLVVVDCPDMVSIFRVRNPEGMASYLWY